MLNFRQLVREREREAGAGGGGGGEGGSLSPSCGSRGLLAMLLL